MTATPIAFRTNEARYSFSGSPRLINAYAEKQDNDGKRPLVLLPCPGLTTFAEVTDRACRGTLYLTDLDAAYTVHGISVYKTTWNGVSPTSTAIGVVAGSDNVQMSRNQGDPVQISIHCAAGEFYIENDVIKQVTDEDLFDDIVSTDGVAGYTVYGNSDGRFQISSINDCTAIDGLDFATAEQSADGLVKVFAEHGDLFLFGQRSVEVWRNTGQVDFPFAPVGGTNYEIGLIARDSVADSGDNVLLWVGNDNAVHKWPGQTISTHGIDRTIAAETSPGNIMGFAWDFQGHRFYNLTGTDWSRSYDTATAVWHSRESYNIGHWRAVFPFKAWGRVIFGDMLTGKLLQLDEDAFDEDGDLLVWGMDSPILHVFPNGGIVDAVHFDVATGVGLTSGQGQNPIMMLSWSTDGGKSFHGNRQLSLGTYGNYSRVTARRLGRFGPSGIQFRVRISDPVIRALVGVDVAVRPLKR